MELWIRSQDKKCLIKAKIIKYENSCLRGATDDDGWYYDLGKYKKERALEVLDEIQHKLITLCDSMNRHLYVYEMPEE